MRRTSSLRAALTSSRPRRHNLVVTKLYFILGCTACGKGAVGRTLARRIGGQIVSVDSMKIYRRMDNGTAKPIAEARREVPYHCIDIVEPNESFSVAQYVEHADRAIQSIASSSTVPLAIGGTSLYIKALSEGLFEGATGDPSVRASLRALAAAEGLEKLHAELARIDPEAARRIHPNDERRVIRALEVFQTTGRPISSLQKQWDSGTLRYDCAFIGLRRGREDISRRINARTKRMMDLGLVDEVSALLGEPGGISDQAAQAVGYAEIIAYLRGQCTLEQAIERIKVNTRHLAKKQRTWHRRWGDVRWFDLGPDDPPEATAERIISEIAF